MVKSAAERRASMGEASRSWRSRLPDLRGWTRANNRRSAAKRRALLDELKSAPCMDCGGTFPPECMDFHHVRGEKLFSLGHYVNGGKSDLQMTRESAHGASRARLTAEIEKCDLVCANCHRIRTRERKMAHRTEEGW